MQRQQLRHSIRVRLPLKTHLKYPMIVPPTQAPVFIRIEALEEAELSSCFPTSMKVWRCGC